ncbi:MHS family alpha-ketoglutarate permease-like MFS transporter [Sinomonas atrocyanea]|uniref:MFS transporter n=1 Tax=Sinomonas atrocyanea TaxID=37927 RepID=UPI002788E550|nr:MFS transporter [Sinomonas atrocyanea]MDQ0259100.1 MHS family alpha-ketoglutarate permease-like MFS transporter [Sinomonas atrocyanea]
MSTNAAVAGRVRKAPSTRQTLMSTGVGNAVEWFDWNVYATFAPFFSKQLFNGADPTSAILSTLAVFAVGFLARPFGGLVFGWIGDRIGRRTSMTLAVALAAFGSLLIALAPTFTSVGALASLVLLVARLIQGLAHGGELPSSQTYLSEVAPREKRGLWSSLIYVSGTMGVLFGTFLGVVLTSVLSKAQMDSFGWRIPFFLGAVLGLYGLIMRARMPETEAFERLTDGAKKPRHPLWRSIVEHRKQALQVIGMTVGLTIIYYVWGVVAPAFAISSLHIDPTQALWAGVGANVVFLIALPLWGRVSDRIGRKKVLIIGGVGVAVLHFPMTWLLHNAAWQLFISMSVMLVFIACSAAIVPAAYAEMFPAHIRTVGVGVPYSICVALFGGTAPYLQQLFSDVFHQSWMFNVYAVLMVVVSILTVLGLPETKGKDLRR